MRRHRKRREQMPLPGVLRVELVELAIEMLARCELADKVDARRSKRSD